MSTIKASGEIDTVFSAGKRYAQPQVLTIVAPSPPGRDPMGRVAFIAGKKLGGAVVRNRARRVLRAGAAQAGAPWPGLDVLLIARPALLKGGSTQAAETIRALARRFAPDRGIHDE